MSKYLITQRMIDELKGMGIDIVKERRRTGRSTAIAFQTLAAAMFDPGARINIVDHEDHPMSQRFLTNLIMDIIEKLGLSGYEVSKNGKWLKFNLYEPSEDSDEA